MSAVSDQLLRHILDRVEGLAQRVIRLETAIAENSRMALELAELRAEAEVGRRCQHLVNDAQNQVNQHFARLLGGELVYEPAPTPPWPRPDLRVVVDNDPSPPSESS
jgi:hypothetical protein